MRYLTAVLVMGLLSACSLGATSPSEQPLPSIDQSAEQATAESMEASSSDDMTAMGCDDAWASVDATGVSSIGDLEAIATDLQATIEQCESLDAWTSGASDAFPDLDTSEVEAWAAGRCSSDATLGQTAVGMEING